MLNERVLLWHKQVPPVNRYLTLRKVPLCDECLCLCLYEEHITVLLNTFLGEMRVFGSNCNILRSCHLYYIEDIIFILAKSHDKLIQTTERIVKFSFILN